jgi:hypothetical protein
VSDTDTPLAAHRVVDKALLARNIRQALQERSQVTLRELIDAHPLRNGLAELLAYLQLGAESIRATVDEQSSELIAWESTASDGVRVYRQARLPRVIFER